MNKLSLFFFAIFLISFVSANLIMSPTSSSVSSLIGQSQQVQLNITNNFTHDIFKFSVSNASTFGITFPEINLSVNQSKLINFTFTPTSSFSGSVPLKISFKYYANIPTAVTTYPMNFNQNGFAQSFILIRQGDSVQWFNQDTITHTISSASLFSNAISPSSSNSYAFNQLGTFDVRDENYDEFSYWIQSVQVINRTSQEEVTNPSYDVTWSVNINYNLNPTILEVEAVENNFSVDSLGSTQGLLRIKNTGNETAVGVSIASASNWIIPAESNFNLIPNQQKFVVYTISPLIFETSETNKTYFVNITTKGTNTEIFSDIISVFIPFNPQFDNPDSAEGIFSLLQKQIEKFCRDFPTACLGNQTIIQNGSGADGNVTFNASLVDITEIKRSIDSLETSDGRIQTDLRTLADLYGINLPTLLKLMNETATKQIEDEKSRETWSRVKWIVGSIVVIGIAITSLIVFNYRIKKKKEITEGMFEYDRWF